MKKPFAILLSVLLLFSGVALTFADDNDNPFTDRPSKPFKMPIEVAYVFVLFVVAAVIIYVVLKWIFVED